jgi:hypothetical protein
VIQIERPLASVSLDGIYWLSRLLAVLDNEPFLVLHPGLGIGFRLNVSGVADNFQLHTLLADLLIEDPFAAPSSGLKLPGQKPSAAVAAVAKGAGPMQIDEGSEGVWDMYQWTAVEPSGHLRDDVPSEHWIWGEGIPADIEVRDGFRVILLGSPSYSRSWNTARQFDAMRPRITVEETLDKAAVTAWMRRFGLADR